MPYYSNSDIERLNAVEIRQVLEKVGIEYNARSKKYRCPSPMHEDRHPSMSVKNNHWKCFSCGAGGNVISLVMTVYGIDFQNACQWVASNFNISIGNRIIRTKKYTAKKKQPSIVKELTEQTTGDAEVLQYILNSAALSRQAQEFLFTERRFSEEVVRSMQLGSISDSTRFVRFLKHGFPIERLLKEKILYSNVYGASSIWTAPCILFPFYDIDGKLINIVSRRLDECEPKDKFRSVAGVNTIPYNLPILKTLKQGETLCIMEGLTDTIAALSNGWKAIGLHGCTNRLVDYRDLIKPFHLVYYHDNDDAGRKSFAQRQEELKQYFIPLDEGMIDKHYKDFSAYYAANRT